MKEYKFQSHVDWIKNKFGFYVDLYEVTCTDLKLKQRRDMERQMMAMSDMESRLYNYQKDEGEIAKMIYDE